MSNVPVFDWKSTVSVGGPTITDFDFPTLAQENPFDAKALFTQFCENFEVLKQKTKSSEKTI